MDYNNYTIIVLTNVFNGYFNIFSPPKEIEIEYCNCIIKVNIDVPN